MTIPDKEECLRLLRENGTPENVIAHTTAVHDFAVALAEDISERGFEVNTDLVAAAALLHDIEKLKPNHVKAGHDLLVRRGYPEVATVVLKHGLEHLDDPQYVPKTTEEKLVFYADKRVRGDTVVSVDERFRDIKERYNAPHIDEEIKIVKTIEKELLSEAGEDYRDD